MFPLFLRTSSLKIFKLLTVFSNLTIDKHQSYQNLSQFDIRVKTGFGITAKEIFPSNSCDNFQIPDILKLQIPSECLQIKANLTVC